MNQAVATMALMYVTLQAFFKKPALFLGRLDVLFGIAPDTRGMSLAARVELSLTDLKACLEKVVTGLCSKERLSMMENLDDYNFKIVRTMQSAFQHKFKERTGEGPSTGHGARTQPLLIDSQDHICGASTNQQREEG